MIGSFVSSSPMVAPRRFWLLKKYHRKLTYHKNIFQGGTCHNWSMSGNRLSPLDFYLKVYVNLVSGKTYFGTLKSVGHHFIHLEKLADKHYYDDALIPMETIIAIDVKFR